MSTNTVIIVGNLTADPELRQTSGGGTVVNFTIASTERRYNRKTGQWEDGRQTFLRCNAWDSQYSPIASNISQTLRKGMRVIASGTITSRSYTGQDGMKRYVTELQIDEIGPALSRNTAQVMKNGGDNRGAAVPQNGAAYGGQPQTGYNPYPGSQFPQPGV